MKLMRHSDLKLTAKFYTDETQLPIYDAIKSLHAGETFQRVRRFVPTLIARCDDSRRTFRRKEHSRS